MLELDMFLWTSQALSQCFWLGRLENINDGKNNNSTSLNPEFFAEKFELNDDYQEFLDL